MVEATHGVAVAVAEGGVPLWLHFQRFYLLDGMFRRWRRVVWMMQPVPDSWLHGIDWVFCFSMYNSAQKSASLTLHTY